MLEVAVATVATLDIRPSKCQLGLGFMHVCFLIAQRLHGLFQSSKTVTQILWRSWNFGIDV